MKINKKYFLVYNVSDYYLSIVYDIFMKNQEYFLWIDCEMTGLSESDHILEIALVLTDTNLLFLKQDSYVVGHQKEVLEGMNDWCKENHEKITKQKKEYTKQKEENPC